MDQRFAKERVFRELRFSLGDDRQRGAKFLSIPVSNRMVDYEEYYRLSPAEFASLLDDETAGKAFANDCRRHLHDDRLLEQPGSDRGTAPVMD